MSTFFATLSEFFYTAKNTLASVFGSITVFSVIDILILAFLIYKGIEFCRDSRANTLFKGILLIVIMYAFSVWLGMTGINWLLSKIIDSAFVILIIIFQPELRRALERVGHSSFGFFGRANQSVDEDMAETIDMVCRAAASMSKDKIGALIVFENKTPLGEVINTGTVIDAAVSIPLICNIFYPKSPLHDGAAVIGDNRVKAAGCILPLTMNQDISSELGTRHRAAIGISENSDSVTVVVSEETGNISLTRNGAITRNYNMHTLKQELYSIFVDKEKQNTNPIASFFKSFKKKGGDGDE